MFVCYCCACVMMMMSDSSDVTPPPRWLESLMNACFSELDFSVRAIAISLLMDLVGLTQSVAMVTAERVGVADSSQPMSPSQGRVAVVIRPVLTQGMLKHIADKTDFFKVTRKSLSLLPPSVYHLHLFLPRLLFSATVFI